MKNNPERRRAGKLLAGALLPAMIALSSGCRTLGFYTQAIKGQCEVLASAKSIEKRLESPETPMGLKQRLELVEDLRQFADMELKLPAGGQYRKYADLHRPFVVWNVEAAPEFSMEPKSWWYPFVGSLQYHGYFSLSGATNYAAYLRKKGYDVSVGGVQAYSTLGWFKDPVLNTFIFEPDAQLAEILFHELAHQRVFARGDTDFNEAFATAVGQEGARRWLRAKGAATASEEYAAYLKRNAQFVELVGTVRRRLEILFGDQRDEAGNVKRTPGRRDAGASQLRDQKAQLYLELKQQLQRLRANWTGPSDYDDWFDQPINNAHLNSIATYYGLVPGFERLLDENAGNLEQFYGAVARLAKKPKKERHEALRALKPPVSAPARRQDTSLPVRASGAG